MNLVQFTCIALFLLHFSNGLNITLGSQTAGGNYDIYVNGEIYFPASDTKGVSIHHNGIVYSASPEDNNNFLKPMQRDVISQGVDNQGSFIKHTTKWLTEDTNIPMTTSATIYDTTIVFTQSFPKGTVEI